VGITFTFSCSSVTAVSGVQQGFLGYKKPKTTKENFTQGENGKVQFIQIIIVFSKCCLTRSYWRKRVLFLKS
jgi:hypothetical protein